MLEQILIVDDDEAVLEQFKGFLRKMDFQVETAQSAEVAVEKIAGCKFALMFLDLHLPGGMSGMELCRKIRQSDHHATLIAITSYTTLFEHADCLKAGFDSYYKKPIQKGDVLQCIKTMEDLRKQRQ